MAGGYGRDGAAAPERFLQGEAELQEVALRTFGCDARGPKLLTNPARYTDVIMTSERIRAPCSVFINSVLS